VLVPFLVSRQLICGAGKVLHTARGRGVQRQPARRAHLGERVVGDHPQPADHQHQRRAARRPERFRRLHVIVGDSNMSETTTLLKVGSAELVLRLIEAGVPMRDFTLENPIRAIRDMSRDRSGQ
jgi:proteasome accessory factor A